MVGRGVVDQAVGRDAVGDRSGDLHKKCATDGYALLCLRYVLHGDRHDPHVLMGATGGTAVDCRITVGMVGPRAADELFLGVDDEADSLNPSVPSG